MRKIQLFSLVIPALLMSAAPLAAQCHMAYNVSVYTDGSVSDDLSTVYGYSNFVDNSTLCGATHSNYQSLVTIYAPGGSDVSQPNAGTETSTSMATNGNVGTYTVVGTASLYCSVAQEQIQSGGPQTPVQVTPSLTVNVSPASCTIHLQNSTCTFVVGASANGGWNGSVSGSISVSAPANPNQVTLSAGTVGVNYTFVLSANQNTGGTCNQPNPSYCYTVTTDASNTNTGSLIYAVILNASTANPPAYLIPGGSQASNVTMNVVNP